MPASKNWATVPWNSSRKSSAGSALLDRYRMIGWPIRMCCWYTSRMKFGEWWWPNSWLKMSTQVPPHDGVAAVAVAAVPSTPAVPTPPTRASVAAVARTLLLMDIKQFLSWNPKQPYPAYGLPELIRTGTADLTGCGKEGKSQRSLGTRHAVHGFVIFHYSARFTTRRAMLARGLPAMSGVTKLKRLSHVTDAREVRGMADKAMTPAPVRGTGVTVSCLPTY